MARKRKEYHCAICGKFFPIGKEIKVRDTYYKDVVHEKCPCCGSIDSFQDVYDDPHGSGKMLAPHKLPYPLNR